MTSNNLPALDALADRINRWLVGLLGLVAFALYMTDYGFDFSTAGWSKYLG